MDKVIEGTKFFNETSRRKRQNDKRRFCCQS